jgi:peptidoglycan-associated lipoprotein
MRKNMWMVLALAVILAAMLFTVSCAKKQVDTGEQAPEPVAQQPVEQPAATTDDAGEKARLEAERLQAQEQERARMASRNAFINEDVYFEFDSAALLPMGQDLLMQKADYMRAIPGLNVTIEGHCDERGTDAYNMALGERRAEAVKTFMINLGISASRLNTISYGEERPADFGRNEEAWAKNRRAHFAVY